MSRFIKTKIGDDHSDDELHAVHGFVTSAYELYDNRRSQVEVDWKTAYSAYMATPQATEYSRSYGREEVGNVGVDWRHRVNLGKAFEIVETYHSYLLQAIFPGSDWFDLTPMDKVDPMSIVGVKKLMEQKFYESGFYGQTSEFMRQLLITGQSIMAMPWRFPEVTSYVKPVMVREFDPQDPNKGFKWVEVDKLVKHSPDYQTLSVFDCWLDTTEHDLSKANFIRRVYMSRSEVAMAHEAGYFNQCSMDDIMRLPKAEPQNQDDGKRTLLSFHKEEAFHEAEDKDTIEVFEFWGNIIANGYYYYDVVCTWAGSKILRFETCPYGYGRPFVVTQLFKYHHDSGYAMGVLKPILGMLFTRDKISNQRLDNLDLAVNCMWRHTSGGILTKKDIFSYPGNVFTMNPDEIIEPIEMPTNFTVSYNDESILEQNIDKTIGTGNFISANASRDAERVTAEEVKATRQAGGARLLDVYSHIQREFTLPVLEKSYKAYQQYLRTRETVVTPKGNNEFEYLEVGAEDFEIDYQIKPQGAEHIITKQEEIDKLNMIWQLASQNPMVAQSIDFVALLKEIARLQGLEVEKFFVQAAPAPQPQGNPIQQPTPTLDGDVATQNLTQAVGQLNPQEQLQQMKDLSGINVPDEVLQPPI